MISWEAGFLVRVQGSDVADSVYALLQSPHSVVQAKAILLNALLHNAFPCAPCLATTPSVAAQAIIEQQKFAN